MFRKKNGTSSVPTGAFQTKNLEMENEADFKPEHCFYSEIPRLLKLFLRDVKRIDVYMSMVEHVKTKITLTRLVS